MPEARFRKRPVEVAAIQWTGENEAEIRSWCGPNLFGSLGPAIHRDADVTAEVLDTLHGSWINMRTGDWVVRGIRGEFYAITDDVLRATYEPVEAVADDA